MSISPPTLSPIHSASGAIPASIHSATTYPFPGVLPLSTPLALPPNQFSAPPSSHTYFPPGSRSPPLSEVWLTMPPQGAAVYLKKIGVVVLPSQSGSSASLPSISLRPTVTTSAGTSLPHSSNFSSNSDISTSPTSRLVSSMTPLTSPTTPSLPSSCLSAGSSSTSGFTFTYTVTPTSTHSFLVISTQTFPATVSSYPSTQPISIPPSTHTTPTLSTASATTSNSPDLSWPATTVVFSTTLVASVSSPPSSSLPPAPTYTITSFVPGQGGTTTDFVTTSSILSTEPPGRNVNATAPLSPGTIAAIVLGIAGAFAFSALWLFCARRRHRQLVREATFFPPEHHASGPLDDEILDVEELARGIGSTHSIESTANQTGPLVEDRYAGILAALHSIQKFGRGNEGGSTGAIYGSRHDTATDLEGEEDIALASSPTLPLHVLTPDDPPYLAPLAPPPHMLQHSYHQTAQPALPPSSYHITSRRKSSPGPDAATLFSGYSVAPSCNSYYARSQTLGSGSGSGSVDALSRTRTGSEEPLLGIGKATPEFSAGPPTPGGISPTATTDPGGNRPGLGSAFGSPAASMYSPSTAHPVLQYDTSGSYGTRSASGSGSYGYPRSGTPSSFDVLGSVSSQGALSSAYSQGHGQNQGFRFGFNRQGSSSSGSTGKKTGGNQHTFGAPPTSFRAWRDRSPTTSEKEKRSEKRSLREKDWITRPRSWTSSASATGSVDEKQGRGSPVMGVRALLGRLRRAGHTPSPHSSDKDLPSPTKPSVDVDPEKAAATDRVTPPPIQIEAATPQRRRFSFILSNPDPHPPSPYSGVGDAASSSDSPPRPGLHNTQSDLPKRSPKPVPFSTGGLQPATPFPTGYVLGSAPSPAPTEESRLAEGLLHPRLQSQGCSNASLRDFEDYSRPIGGVVKNRLYSTTTFGTQDEVDGSPGRPLPMHDALTGDEPEHDSDVTDVFGSSTLREIYRESWFVGDPSPPTTTRHSPARA